MSVKVASRQKPEGGIHHEKGVKASIDDRPRPASALRGSLRSYSGDAE
jgi:hypothetical protein